MAQLEVHFSKVEEISHSLIHSFTHSLTYLYMAYLSALRGSHGIYFVGGKLTANRLTEYDDVSNTTFLYYHPMYDRDSSERLEARGPTNETLYIMVRGIMLSF